MFDKISAGTVKAIEGLRDPETQANRLQDRIDSRKARADKKGKATTTRTVDLGPNPLDPSSSNDRKISVTIKGDAKRDRFDEKTAKLKGKQKDYKDRADEAMQKRIADAKSLRGSLTNEEKIAQAQELYELLEQQPHLKEIMKKY